MFYIFLDIVFPDKGSVPGFSFFRFARVQFRQGAADYGCIEIGIFEIDPFIYRKIEPLILHRAIQVPFGHENWDYRNSTFELRGLRNARGVIEIWILACSERVVWQNTSQKWVKDDRIWNKKKSLFGKPIFALKYERGAELSKSELKTLEGSQNLIFDFTFYFGVQNTHICEGFGENRPFKKLPKRCIDDFRFIFGS